MKDLEKEIAMLEGKLKYAKNFKTELHDCITRLRTEQENLNVLIRETKNLLGSVIAVRISN